MSTGQRCPLDHSTTNGRGVASADDCVCQVGFYLEGAHREGSGRCVPCPTGTSCTGLGATVVELPLLPDWWRLPNSTNLRRCFSISNCTGGASAADLCGEGYEGPFCGVCSKDDNGTRYHRLLGKCEPCRGSVAPAIGAVAVALLVLCLIAVAFKRSERVKRVLRLRLRSVMDKASKDHAEVRETEYELPDVDLPSISETLRLKFPDVPWPELPSIHLSELSLPQLAPFTLAEFARRFPNLTWPSTPNLAFLCNLLRIALPDLDWPALPDLSMPGWEWPEWTLPDVDLPDIVGTLRQRFPQLEWPDLPALRLLDVTLPRLTLPEFEAHFPHLAPWPSTPDLAFLSNVLRITFPNLQWPTLPDLQLPGWSLTQPLERPLPDWAIAWSLPDLDPSLTLFNRVLVKLRILISMIQVLSQLGVVYSIPFPDVYANLLRWLSLLEINLPEILPLECIWSLSFYVALLLRTLLLPALGLTFVAMRAARAPRRAVDAMGGALFVILFLIYPSTSAAIFSTFQCEPLDDGTSWLRADLSIDCQSGTHGFFMGYAVLMVFVYPIGTPILYYVLLRRHKPRLDKLRVNQTLRIQLLEEVRAKRDYASSHVSTNTRQVPWLISKAERARLPMGVRRQLRRLEREELQERKLLPGSVAKLLEGYELRAWWFEIFECFRKLAVACLPVFFRPSGSPEQLMYGLLTCFICFGAFVHFDPFEDRGNDALARLCHAQIFFSLLSSVALVFASAGASLDILLVLLWCLPVCLTIFLESRLLEAAFVLAERWRSRQIEAGTWDRLKIKAVSVAQSPTAERHYGQVHGQASTACCSTTFSGGPSVSDASQVQLSIVSGTRDSNTGSATNPKAVQAK